MIKKEDLVNLSRESLAAVPCESFGSRRVLCVHERCPPVVRRRAGCLVVDDPAELISWLEQAEVSGEITSPELWSSMVHLSSRHDSL